MGSQLSLGVAPALQAGGRRFEPGWVHQTSSFLSFGWLAPKGKSSQQKIQRYIFYIHMPLQSSGQNARLLILMSLVQIQQEAPYAILVQLIERLLAMQKVAGLSPACRSIYAGVAQQAAQLTCNQQVAGSIPVASSNTYARLCQLVRRRSLQDRGHRFESCSEHQF